MFCNGKRKVLTALITMLFLAYVNAQSQGESLFKENKPKEAVQVLENEILNGLVTANTYNFLGLGYYQIGEYSKSIDAFNRGIAAQPTLSKVLMYNQGNSYYAMKDYTSAIRCYSDVLKENPTFYDALLNRANALLMASQLKNAREEYIDYIAKCPSDPQRPEIEKLIKALEDEIVRREEEERLLAEQNKAKWEEYDGSINDEKTIPEEERKAEWEKFDAGIADERVEKTEPPKNPKTPWEKVSEDKLTVTTKPKTDDELVIEDNWQTLSDEDEDELRELDKLSKEEREKWLAEQKRQKELERQREIEKENEIKNAEKLRLQQQEEESRLAKEQREEEERLRKQRIEDEDRLRKQKIEDEERLAREKLMEEMMRAENERKQKLLENLANSLQNSETTNMTSGADDIIDYDLEGELD